MHASLSWQHRKPSCIANDNIWQGNSSPQCLSPVCPMGDGWTEWGTKDGILHAVPPYIDQRHIGMTLNLPVNKTCRRAAFSARLAAFIKDLSKEIATSAHIKLILEPLRVRDEDSMLLIIGEAQKETFEGNQHRFIKTPENKWRQIPTNKQGRMTPTNKTILPLSVAQVLCCRQVAGRTFYKCDKCSILCAALWHSEWHGDKCGDIVRAFLPILSSCAAHVATKSTETNAWTH